MRYIMTIIWSLLISAAVSYVLSSMAGEPFIISEVVILALVFMVVVFLLGEAVLKGEKIN